MIHQAISHYTDDVQAFTRESGIMDFEDLTPEQQAKARACKTPEDLLALAREEGLELSDEELENMSGGWLFDCGKLKDLCNPVRSPHF